jgi:DNA-binding NarL/FixJ family response regulator
VRALAIGQTAPLMAVSLLIVDDHAAFRGFVSELLAAEGFEVAGAVPDGESAVAAVEDLRPDAVLLDIQLPGIDGFEVARRIAALEHGPRVVLTSLRDASDYGRRITDSPAMGFLPKQQLSGAALAALLAAPGPCG